MRKLFEGVRSRLPVIAIVLMVVSLLADVVTMAVGGNGYDLQIYRGATAVLPDGLLYDYRRDPPGSELTGPFIYPPFAALLLYPLSLPSWVVAKWLWHAVSVGALWVVIRATQRLLPGGGTVTSARLWLAGGLWLEPVRFDLVYGQVNLVLAAFVLFFVASGSQARGGAAVGVAAGFKLTPAVAGLYFLATRQFRAAAISVAAFLSTVAIGWLVLPGETRHYWKVIVTDSEWIAPVGQVLNQSLRGALSRTAGHDVRFSLVWLLAAAVVVVLALLALRNMVRVGDRLAALISVHLLALLLSPISWDHHWVWAVPVLMWLRHTTVLSRTAVVVNAVLWWVMTVSWVVILLNWLQVSPRVIERTWYLMWLGWAYPLCGIVLLATLATTRWITSTYSAVPTFAGQGSSRSWGTRG